MNRLIAGQLIKKKLSLLITRSTELSTPNRREMRMPKWTVVLVRPGYGVEFAAANGMNEGNQFWTEN